MRGKQFAWMALAAGPWAAVVGMPSVPERPSYGKDVAPILKAHCASCHGKDAPAAGLDVTSAKALAKVVVKGDPVKSILLERIKGHGGKPRMPLGFAPLSDAQTKTIENWIRNGAAFDAGPSVHWAYVAPKRPALPAVRRESWVQNPIDRFVLARLERGAIGPSTEADRRTLIRRVYLDLIGIPPTPDEVAAFLADASPNAYEKVVDRLLDSPHYGERMARPWLDLSRYADSDGYEKDLGRVAWKYRDWVINAYNRNMPFDQFTVEQIAGDMLPKPSVDQLVATGFHRNTMQNLEGGVDQAEAHFTKLIDRVDTTATVWLGSTLACSRCHDHKYDPFTQRDYYSMLAVWNNTVIEPRGDKTVSEEKWLEPTIEIAAPEVIAARDRARAAKDKAKEEEAQRQIVTAMVMREKPSKGLLKERIRNRGEFLNLGNEVEAGTPSILPPLKERANRLTVAKWLVDRRNPLTARVQVNRMWELHFGRGLVETTEDFGTQGAKPSHPELLDWLAVEFMESGWDVKHMHRLMVTSATYRQTSRSTPFLLKRDPENRLLARGARFRLEAELIRDNALAISGLLNDVVGGPSVYPDQPDGVWDTPYSGEYWTPSAGKDRWRRGMYTFWKRTAPHPLMLNFDATSRETCTVRRVRTNTPLQALNLMNDPAMMEASKALAKDRTIEQMFQRAVCRPPNPQERNALESLFRRTKDRYAADPKAAGRLAGTPDDAARTMVASVILNLDETITRE